MATCSCLSPKGLHKAILNLAYERGIRQEDLSFCEILVTIFGCRPARIGPISVQGFSLEQLVDVCRKEEHDDFHFETDSEQDAYKLDREAASTAVVDLEGKGLVKIIPHDQLIWDEHQPRVKSLKKNEMVRLTEEGQKFVEESKPRKPILPHKCPA